MVYIPLLSGMAERSHRRRRPEREHTPSSTSPRPEASTPNQHTIIEISDDDDSDTERLPLMPSSCHRHRNTSRNEYDVPGSDNGHLRRIAGEKPLQRCTSQHHKRIKTEMETGLFPESGPSYSKRGISRQTTPSLPSTAPAVRSAQHSHPGSRSHHRHQTRYSATPTHFFDSATTGTDTQVKLRPTKKDSASKPPYYMDSRLEVKMYRGHGYESFPVVLGTVEGHQELCEKWDAEQITKLTKKAAKLRQTIRTPYLVHDTDSESDSDSKGQEISSVKKYWNQCLVSVLDVFPDIERVFVMKKIQLLSPDSGYDDRDDEIIEIGPPRAAEIIIADVLEMDHYPKERVATSLASGSRAANDGTGVTITWNRDLFKGDMYTKDAVIILAKTFDRVPTHYIAKVVSEKNSIFDAYVHIQNLEARFYSILNRPYSRLRHARSTIEKKYGLTYHDRRIPSEYANRINELQAAKQHVAREAIKAAAKEAKSQEEAANLALHKESGAVMECQCCFDDQVPLNRLVSCMADQSHFFCFTCVESLADTQVGLMRYEMRCMDGSGCASELSHEGVGKAVPIKTFDLLQLNKQQAEIIAAGIRGLEECRFCDYKAICEDVSVESVFYCQNPDCSRATCRKCNKDSHLPKTCEEIQTDSELSARHLIEEARSDAIMRTCPKCKVKIVKEYGCNKMVCTKCHTILCYECKADLSKIPNPYDHFSKPEAKCLLYDIEGVNRHEVEANRAETEAIDQAKEKHADIDPSKLRIGTGKQAQPALQEHDTADALVRHMNIAAEHATNHQRRVQAQLDAIFQQVHRVDGVQADAEAYRRRPEGQIRAGVPAVMNKLTGLFEVARNVAPSPGFQRLHIAPLPQRRPLFFPADDVRPARVGTRLDNPILPERLEFEGALDQDRPKYPFFDYPPGMDGDYPRTHNVAPIGRGSRTPIENQTESHHVNGDAYQPHNTTPFNNNSIPRLPPNLPQPIERFGTRLWYRGTMYDPTRL